MSEDQLLGDDDIFDSVMNGQDGELDAIEASLNGERPVELGAIQARVLEMEQEAAKLKQLQTQVDDHMIGPGTPSTPAPGGVGNGQAAASNAPNAGAPVPPTPEAKAEVDSRSVYVGNVDYGATAEELEAHFHGCGNINRVTILCNKYDGHPKGFAYIEFADKDSVQTAMAMDESLFRGRQIKVNPKRTNKPGMCVTNRGGPPRGRGFRGTRTPFTRGSGYMYSTGYRPARRARSYRRASYFPY